MSFELNDIKLPESYFKRRTVLMACLIICTFVFEGCQRENHMSEEYYEEEDRYGVGYSIGYEEGYESGKEAGWVEAKEFYRVPEALWVDYYECGNHNIHEFEGQDQDFIIRVSYNDEENEMAVFTGKEYQYEEGVYYNVPREVYDEFIISENPNEYYKKYVLKHYYYVRLW